MTVEGEASEREPEELVRLRESEAKLRSISENLAEGMVYQIDCGADGLQRSFSYLSPAVERMHGLKVEDVMGNALLLYDQVIEADRALVAQKEAHAFATRTRLEVDVRVMHPSLGIRWRRFTSSPRVLPDGSFVWDGIEIDITEQKQSEEALRESEAQLRFLSANLAEGMVYQINTGIDGQDRRFTYLSPAVERLHGIKLEDALQNSLLIYSQIIEADRKVIAEKEARAIANRRRFEFDARVRLPSGELRWRRFISSPRACPDGSFVWDGIEIDINELKRAEEELKRSEELFRTLFEILPVGVSIMDDQRRILIMNRSLERILDVGRDKLSEGVYQKWEYIHEDGTPIPLPCLPSARAIQERKTVEQTEIGILRPGLPALWTSVSAAPLPDGRAVVVTADSTERRQLEDERIKTQKLESIGKLAGGIAHDFNNLLQGIFGYIGMAKVSIDEKEEVLAMLEQAEKALHIAVNLTTQLLTFSKGGKPLKMQVKLGSVIGNAAKFALSGSKADYSLDLAEDLMTVNADEGQIAQVIQNIVLNADQSMPSGGKVIITARNLQSGEKKQRGLPAEAEYVEIAIQDSGVGIPKQHLPNIFDPYFTTKEKGSGIGLATTYSIIKNHGGQIRVESEVGKGSTFFIYLPCVREGEKSLTVLPDHAETRAGRVLMMDDDEMVRDLIEDMIRSLGHEVDCVADGEAAIRQYRSAMESGAPYDIVILDLTVRGGMGGVEAMRRLRALDPEIRAIVSSGYSDDPVTSDYQAHGFRAFLRKPYLLEELRDALNSLLVCCNGEK